MTRHSTIPAGVATAALAAMLLSSCAAAADEQEPEATAADAASSHVALTYDGGVLVVDGETLEQTADIPIDGFNRINPAGDGAHAFLSTATGFQAVDVRAGELTDLVFPATTPGHVVLHHGRTALFDDGTGDITLFDTDALGDSGSLPESETVTSPEAHHGVAIELADGTLLATIGTSEGRTGVRVLDADRHEVATSEECPSVHGEGALDDDTVVFGCEDGVLVYADGALTKLDAPDEHGRSGNAYMSDASPLAVLDYDSDPDSEGYLLDQLAVVDTATLQLHVIDVPEGDAYTWRGVSRGPAGEVVLVSDAGAVVVLDPETGEQITRIDDVVAPWESPVEWQDSHPGLEMHGSIAYVTEPATNELHAVDIATGEVVASSDIGVVANELAVIAVD